MIDMKYVVLLLLFGLENSSFVDLVPKKEPSVTISIETRIRNKFLECGITDSATVNIFIAQAKLESGNFTNKLTREHNNLFAMRHPSRRLTRSLGPHAKAEGRKGYASFATIEDSVEDFILYLEFCKYPTKITDVDQYTKLLKKKKYFESSTIKYSKGIKHYLNGTK
jgi:hypothetical protein